MTDVTTQAAETFAPPTAAPAATVAPVSPPAAPLPWTAGLDADTRAFAEAKGWKEPAAAISAVAKLEQALGHHIPAPPSDPEKLASWEGWAKLGRPETPDKYDLSGFKPPEGLPWNDEVAKGLLPTMHKLGLSNAQVNALLSAYATAQHGEYQKLDQTVSAAAAGLKAGLQKEWGRAYDARLALANKAAAMAFGPDLEAARQIQLTGGVFLLDHPVLAKALARIGEQVGESGSIPGGQGTMAMTPDQARSELAALRRDKARVDILLNRAHPEHDAMVELNRRLFEMAYPEHRA